MKLNKREKILLAVLSFIILVGGYYRFVFSYQRDKLNNLIKQKEEYEKKLDNINMQTALMNKNLEDIKDLNVKIGEMTLRFFPGIMQENFIVDIDKLLSESKFKGLSFAFSDIKAVPIEEVKQEEKDDKTSSLKGIVDEYNGAPSKNKSESTNNKKSDKDNKDKPSVENISLSINFKGTYKNLTEFLKNVENYSKKIVVSNLQINENENNSVNEDGSVSENHDISGSIQLEFYAIPKISDEDKEFFKWAFNNKYGKDNPFDGKVGSKLLNSTIESSGKTNKEKSYDFVMSVRPVNSDLPTVMLGRSKDYSKQSYITADNPGTTNVEVYLTQKNDKYYYKYKAGKLSFPLDSSGDGEQFSVKDGNISFMIYSNKRIDKSDLSGVNLKIYNKTDKVVNVIIDRDDTASPRISISGEGGSVDIKRN